MPYTAQCAIPGYACVLSADVHAYSSVPFGALSLGNTTSQNIASQNIANWKSPAHVLHSVP